MKYKPHKTVFLGIAILGSVSLMAQQSSDTVAGLLSDAQDYLNASHGKPFNVVKALELNQKAAETGSAQALNALGVHYSKGLGVDADLEKATAYFKQASDLGYLPAKENLVGFFKRGYGAEVDHQVAYKYQQEIHTLHPTASTKFQLAYMYYKGLGTSQDYNHAYNLLQESAKAGHSGAMYFLGLSFRNGYGCVRNENEAKKWLQAAASKGSGQAKDELNALTPENPVQPFYLPKGLQTVSAQLLRTIADGKSLYQRQSHNITGNQLEGHYTGFTVRYDWSGKNIISMAPLELSLENKDGEITGEWTEDGSIKTSLKASLSNEGLSFSNTSFNRKDHYAPAAGEVWQFTNAVLQLAQNTDSAFIAGNLRLFSPTRKEPGKPFYIFLQRKINTAEVADLLGAVQVYPNPVQKQAQLAFTLFKTTAVTIKILDGQGKMVAVIPTETLLPGTYKRSIAIQGAPGTYMLNLEYNGGNKTLKIIKQ